MIQPFLCLFVSSLLSTIFILTPALTPADDSPAKPDAEKHTLRYRFQPGELLRWNVVHRCQVRTTVSGTTQTAETTTTSVKVWRVAAVRADGAITFDHLVESVDMRHKLTGREEVHYNSQANQPQPAGFENITQAVGVPLSTVTMDARGKVLHRKRYPVKASAPSEGEITIPLPAEPVAVGQQWSLPHDIEVPLPNGGIRTVKAVQSFTLLSVKTGVATIRMATQILTPVHDPALESQLIQFETAGTVRFDLDAGRIIGQQMDVDKTVLGFRGQSSAIQYVNRFTEDFLSADHRPVAARPAAKVERK